MREMLESLVVDAIMYASCTSDEEVLMYVRNYLDVTLEDVQAITREIYLTSHAEPGQSLTVH